MCSPGYLLLIHDNGDVSAIRTAGMDRADLVWDERGLFFSDTGRDYLLTESGLTTWDSPKTEVQVEAWPMPDRYGWVSVYNYGFGDSSSGQFDYIQQVVETTADGVTRYDVPGYTTLTAQCGSTIYGAAEVGEPYTSLAQGMGAVVRDDVAPYWPDMLTQIYPLPSTWAEGLRSVRLGGYDGYGFKATCRDDVILGVTGGQNEPPQVVVWPTNGDEPSTHMVLGPEGETLGLDSEIALYATSATPHKRSSNFS